MCVILLWCVYCPCLAQGLSVMLVQQLPGLKTSLSLIVLNLPTSKATLSNFQGSPAYRSYFNGNLLLLGKVLKLSWGAERNKFQSPGISHLGSCDRLLPSLPGWVPPCSQFTFLFPSEGSFWKANLIISIWLKSPQKLLFHDKIQIPFPGLKGLSWLSLTHHHPLPSPGTVRTCELMPGDHRNGPCFPWLWGICFLLLLVFKHSDDLLPSVSYRVLQAWLRTEVPSGLMRLKWNYPQRRVLETRRENPFPCLFQLLFLNFQF